MKRFIFTERGGIYIIDLTQTSSCSRRPTTSCATSRSAGGTILFVGTKKQAQDSVAQAGASACRTSRIAGSAAC
jgi:small subunit ribosomal protein S2